ncbi:hypothetical protein FACS189421_11320 [Bacteroidia bacterium]|nr:hypothetical protein FACS189421_11320 [Bacteroidia bacterium]GHT02462.1 hypothetical protein FACS189423_01210 [Bacteroidia bacterium]GHT49714.1 hypothetical protein FACS189440_15900 [Bacteroidia bacterium]
MEYIIQILMLFIGINCVLKLSFRKGWQTVAFGFICAVFIISVCPFAILQSKTQLADFLNNTRVMQDAAVLITIESVICFGFCFFSLREIPGRKKGKWWMIILDWYPGLLIFPVLFYVLTQIIFSLSGTSFTLIAYLFAGGVLAGLPLLTWLIKRLYPEKEFRLELHFIVSLFVCIIGLIATVDGTVTYSAVNETFNAKAIVVSATLFAVLFLIGFGWNRMKWRIKKNK